MLNQPSVIVTEIINNSHIVRGNREMTKDEYEIVDNYVSNLETVKDLVVEGKFEEAQAFAKSDWDDVYTAYENLIKEGKKYGIKIYNHISGRG